MDAHFLTPLFAPQSITLFHGEADGHQLLDALGSFRGKLNALSAQTPNTLAELAAARADLAILATPPEQLTASLEAAARVGCRSAVVLASGVAEDQADALKAIASREGMHLLGPNSLGFQRPGLQLNASTAGPLARAGSLALVSQSGALTASMLDWAASNGVGFSLVVSLGPGTAVDIAQALDFLADDPQTQSIVVYVEGITSARRFMSALRSAASAKPVVVLKAGRKPAGNEAAHTHSRAMVGSDDVFDAALRRAGAVRVQSFVQLFSAAKCLASRFRPVGKRLAVVTNGGGPGVLAADWVNEISLSLAKLSAASVADLAPQLPPAASLADLIDLSEDALPEHYRAAVQAADRDRQVDGVLVIHSPKPGHDAMAVAEALVAIRPSTTKPLLSCWMGDATVGDGRKLLNDASIPSFRTPEAAVGAFGNIASFHENQQMLLQTPSPLSSLAEPDIEGARLLLESVLAERRKVLTEMESKALLSAFHVPVTQTLLARSANEAMMIATQLGFPVAMKVDSADIPHKSDVDGVVLGVSSGAAARDTFNEILRRVKALAPGAQVNGVTVQKMASARRGREVSIGLVTDQPFGPVLVFGAGGVMIELLDDRAMELPPLNRFLAQRLIERARVAQTLGEWRGAPAIAFEALERVLLRVSEMVCALPQLREMDINPLIVDEHGAVAVDARVVIASVPPSSDPTQAQAHLAILPYPTHYEQAWPLRGGGSWTLRPIHPGDATMLQDFVQRLSPESRYFRFVSHFKELPLNMLARFTLIDYDREMALVAVVEEGGQPRIVGVSRYITNPDRTSCEFSLVVSDDYKGRGLGSRLMESIIDVARDRGLATMEGLVLAQNAVMLQLVRALGFGVKRFAQDPDFHLVSRAL